MKPFNDSKYHGDYITHYCPTCDNGSIEPDYFKSTKVQTWRSCETCALSGKVNLQKQFDKRASQKEIKSAKGKDSDFTVRMKKHRNPKSPE